MLIEPISRFEIISTVVESDSSRNSMLHIADIKATVLTEITTGPHFFEEAHSILPVFSKEFLSYTDLGDTYLPQLTFIRRRQDYVSKKIKGQRTILRIQD